MAASTPQPPTTSSVSRLPSANGDVTTPTPKELRTRPPAGDSSSTAYGAGSTPCDGASKAATGPATSKIWKPGKTIRPTRRVMAEIP